MSYQLRLYQSDLISRIFYQWHTHRRILAQLPTGGGKSVIFGAIASHFVRAGLRVLLMAHREELIVQAYSHLSHWCECGIGIIKMTKSWATLGLPDFPRQWQLEGMPPSKQELEVDNDREVKVKVKPERLIPLADTLPLDRELIEVTGEGAWDTIYADLVAYAIEKGYKSAWIRFRLEELKPPLTIWTKYAQMMEYKPGWAFYRWQEPQRGMAA